MMKRTKAHTVYRVNGQRVPSVTEIIGDNLGWNKNALIGWARKQAMIGNDPDKVRDHAAEIGTLAHAMTSQHLGGEPVRVDEFPEVVIDRAENAFLAYLEWEDQQHLEVVDTEISLTHPDWL